MISCKLKWGTLHTYKHSLTSVIFKDNTNTLNTFKDTVPI